MEQQEPLDRFAAVYLQMKAPSWREPIFESRPRAEKRVLALAKGLHPHRNWSDALDLYMAAYRLALRTAAQMPILGPRTTCWTISSPEAVRRMAGSLSTLTDADLLHWEGSVTWLRLPPESLAVLRQLAAQQGRCAPSLAAELIEAGLDRLAG
jgi:hypothetical protein